MKTLKGIVFLMAFMSFVVSQGFSQTAPVATAQKNTAATTKSTPGKFVDNNKDGVCDNHQAKMNTGKCANFVDKNGDGKCDDCKGSCQGKGKANCCGTSAKNCAGQGKGNCAASGCSGKHKNGCGQKDAPAPGK